MESVTITPMTIELANKFYDGYERDILTFEDGDKSNTFVFSKEWVEEYINKQQSLGHILFAIILGDTPIGEIKLHNISKRRSACEVSINLKSDNYKNKGYGTTALTQVIDYVKDNLQMKTILSRTLLKNIPAQNFLKSLGFKEDYREYKSVYFEKDLTKEEEIKPITLVPMTRELYHKFYKGFKTDVPPKGYRERFVQYIYDEDATETYYRLEKALDRHMFAIMLDGEPIGEVKLQSFNSEEGTCYIECSMQSKEYKNRGYGKNGIFKTLKYAKSLGLKKVCARVPRKNTHAQHVFENIGFVRIKSMGDYYLYEKKL